MTQPLHPKRRRPRYRGTHPRRFAEKYKERDPARFPKEREKVLASGRTPAGSHVPVLVAEVLQALAPAPGDVAVDATLGYGGHASELLRRILPGGRLLALDVDPIELPRAEVRLKALAESLGDASAVKVVKRNFAGLRKLLAEEGLAHGADIVLADLGVSSMQFDDPARGFSWKHDVPLDLRMNPERGQPAGILLLRMKREEIEDFLRRFGDEPEAGRIAAALHQTAAARGAQATHTFLSNSHVIPAVEPTGDAHGGLPDPLHLPRNLPLPLPLRTSDVIRAVESAYEGRTSRDASEAKKSSLQRTLQAIRILVNDELTALDAFLRDLPQCLAPGGRAAIVTFHSGEDRRVKKAFKAGLEAGFYARVADTVLRPTPRERGANPRSSAAKLRWAVRADSGGPHATSGT
ncbi:MAG TPA: 16S rRNA (cytosine(1402)-N(4))-methyltransferase [Thermoanaerobaculia bacterium]|nr:16S rRNA (cytosine(1402)-N(4))-methyltransferase [Thermoanaerobaculia bacterium]